MSEMREKDKLGEVNSVHGQVQLDPHGCAEGEREREGRD